MTEQILDEAEHEGPFLALVVWRDGVYRWSGPDTENVPFLTRPVTVAGQELSQLSRLSPSRRNLGVVAFDQHAGTRYQDKAPLNLYLLSRDGLAYWFRYRSDRSTGWEGTWKLHGRSRLGPSWVESLASLSSCQKLIKASGACDLEKSIFSSGLNPESRELARDFSNSKARVIQEFLESLQEGAIADEDVAWSLED